ncbi:MAG: hypothetical protein IPJ57_20665 [Gemmatimonadetes bacterium]|nr:hypothetical protein [Gemmatimonadota bacterium]
MHRTRAARVVNCTGPNRDYHRVGDPLIQNLRMRGLLTPDPATGLGKPPRTASCTAPMAPPVPGCSRWGRSGSAESGVAGDPGAAGQAAELVG